MQHWSDTRGNPFLLRLELLCVPATAFSLSLSCVCVCVCFSSCIIFWLMYVVFSLSPQFICMIYIIWSQYSLCSVCVFPFLDEIGISHYIHIHGSTSHSTEHFHGQSPRRARAF